MEMSENAKKATSLVDKLSVIINSDGEAVSYDRAEREYGVTPEIVFIRDDRWALGAIDKHRNIAYNMWPESWTHFYIISEQKLRPIDEYQK
jgi:hypothetical protein